MLLFDRANRTINDSSNTGWAPDNKPAQEERGTDGAVREGRHVPEMARILLAGINAQKSSRDNIRALHEMLNKPAPEIEASSWLNCRPMRIEDLRGTIVVLEFWDIWCGACLGEIENLNRIHKSSESLPINVISIHSYTDEISEISRVIAERKIRYPICADQKNGELSRGKTFERYATKAIPRRFFIDVYGCQGSGKPSQSDRV